MNFLFYRVPVLIVLIYQLVPDHIRGRYPYFGKKPSTSVRALSAMRPGVNCWAIMWKAVVDQGGYHPDR